jgi:hypothetical protein
MKGLLTLLMKGRMQAIMAAVVFAILALMVTPLAMLSAAMVMLATLRNGAREGLVVALSATLAIAGLGGLLFNKPIALALLGLMLWAPAWILASILGTSRSLAKALEASAIGGMLIVVLQYVFLDAPAKIWRGMLQEFIQNRLDPAVVSMADQQALLDAVSAWMPGGVGASWMFGMAMSLLLTRWAVAVLDDTKSFAAEFAELRMSRIWLIVLPVLLIPGILMAGEPGFTSHLYLVGMMLFVLQGISVAHGVVKQKQANKGWLFALYFFLFMGAPYSVTAVAAAGYADGWMDFRAKAGMRPKQSDEQDS